MISLSSSSSVLAFDQGGTSLRAALVGTDGHVGCRCSIPNEADHGDAGRWWRMLQRAADAVAREAGPTFAGVQAVCVTGVTRTPVVLDRYGQALATIPLADTSAAALVAALPALAHPEAANLNAYHPAARLLWLARQRPEVIAAAAAVVDPKDELAARLTGRVCTDPLSGARLLAAAEPQGDSLLDRLGVPSRLVPEVLAPTAVIGPVRPGLPGALARLAGRPVVMAAHDSWACVLGLGALEDGAAYNLSGTTEVLGVLSRVPGQADGLVGVPWGDGLHHLGGPSNAGGATLAWAVQLLAPGEAVGDALDRLLALERQPQPALFLPSLNGERTPYWDPGLRGAWLGLQSVHGPADLAWAVLEGIACLNRVVLERAEAVTGPVSLLRFGGGGAASRAWAQVKADLLDREVMTPQEPEVGLLGAGICAWTALGAVTSLDAGQRAMVRTGSVFRPRPARREFADRLFAAWRMAEAAAAPISRTLAGIG